jgi:hypothetical protein
MSPVSSVAIVVAESSGALTKTTMWVAATSVTRRFKVKKKKKVKLSL